MASNMDVWKEYIIPSAVSIAVAEVATLPICTVKTNYQNTGEKSIRDVVNLIYGKRGIGGFYKASYPAVGSQILSSTLRFTTYRYLSERHQITGDRLTDRTISSMIAGVAVTLLTHPLDVCRVSLQRDFNVPRDIKSFYAGYTGSFLKNVVSAPLYMPLYDTFVDFLKDHTTLNASKVYATSSFLTAVMACAITHPIDYYKTRRIEGLSFYQGLNPIRYYKGLSLNLARIAPHFTIFMTLSDLCRDYLRS